MSKRFRCCFGSSIALVCCWPGVRLSCAQIEDPQPELTVGIHNYAGVTQATLTDGQEQATQIFGRVRITLRWLDCPPSNEHTDKFRACGQVMPSGGVFLKVLPERMAARIGLPERNFGVAIPPLVAFVFYQRIQNLAKGRGLLESAVLGLVMAHELGHLLLGTDSHSADGIMSESLLHGAFREAEKGLFPFFTAKQAQRMRSRLLERKPSHLTVPCPEAVN